MSLNVCYDLLSILYQRLEIHQTGDWFEDTEQEVMKAVVSLRAYLYHPPQVQHNEALPNIPEELEGLSPRVREMWELWHNLPREEVIFQAVEHGFLPMAQTFFVTVKKMSRTQVVEDIEDTINGLVLKSLRECQVSQCQKLLVNMVSELVWRGVVSLKLKGNNLLAKFQYKHDFVVLPSLNKLMCMELIHTSIYLIFRPHP